MRHYVIKSELRFPFYIKRRLYLALIDICVPHINNNIKAATQKDSLMKGGFNNLRCMLISFAGCSPTTSWTQNLRRKKNIICIEIPKIYFNLDIQIYYQTIGKFPIIKRKITGNRLNTIKQRFWSSGWSPKPSCAGSEKQRINHLLSCDCVPNPVLSCIWLFQVKQFCFVLSGTQSWSLTEWGTQTQSPNIFFPFYFSILVT